MKIYTCCPEAGCSAHSDTINFLKSYGVEPALCFDEEEGAHYLEFTVPKKNRRKFINNMYCKTNSPDEEGRTILCYCGKWHKDIAKGHVHSVRCNSCERIFSICLKCVRKGFFKGCPWCATES